MPKAMNTGKLRLYLNNSTELVDAHASIADTEMLTDLLDGSSFPQPPAAHPHVHPPGHRAEAHAGGLRADRDRGPAIRR